MSVYLSVFFVSIKKTRNNKINSKSSSTTNTKINYIEAMQHVINYGNAVMA